MAGFDTILQLESIQSSKDLKALKYYFKTAGLDHNQQLYESIYWSVLTAVLWHYFLKIE